jgi:folate-dependent phosphoribosylglycinamide formyltransferase PurN
MKIVIISQNDLFVIPRNIEKILKMNDVIIEGLFVLNVKGALDNKKLYFARGFGLFQSLKMAIAMFAKKIANFLDKCFMHRLLQNKLSIRAIGELHKIPFFQVKSINSRSTLKIIRCMTPDLLVSFSAPCVFKPDLLEIAPFGCINLHCSLLPNYAGLLPSFWVLYRNEFETGATVHYMDDEIDNGSILSQCRIKIENGVSMFDLIDETKLAGGKLICEVIRAIKLNQLKIVENNSSERSYYSWPTIAQLKEFRRKGGRLI